MGGRKSGLFAEPAGEVTRVAEAEGVGDCGDTGAALEVGLRRPKQFTVAPLPESEPAGATHQPVQVVFLQTGAAREFGRPRPTSVLIRPPGALQSGQSGDPGVLRGSFPGTGAAAGIEDEERGPAGREIKVPAAFRGESGNLLPHVGEGLGRELPVAKTVFLRRRAGQIGDQADGAARRLFTEFVEAPGRNEKNGTGPDRMPSGPDALFASAAEVKKELSVRMTVGRVTVEGLEVAVDPQGAHGPGAAAQLEAAQDDRRDRGRRRFGHEHNK